MKSIKFAGCNMQIGKGQEDQYHVIHAKALPGLEGECIMCYELTDEEIAQIVKTRRIWYHRLTFGGLFQPMRITTEQPIESHPNG